LPAALPGEFLAFAHSLADKAGAISLAAFRQGLSVERKADRTPVTEADRGAEAALRQMVEAAYPAHGIVGEEYGSERSDAEFVWVFDPIDGTKAFITGNPQFGNLIALMQDGRPVLGVINMPAQGDRWLGALGHPTTFRDRHGEQPCRTRACPTLAEATFRTGSPAMFDGGREDLHRRLAGAVQLALYSGDCFSYGQVASGWLDLVVEAGLGVYDYLALVPVVEGAGGLMCDWQGNRLGLKSDGRVVCLGDPSLGDEVLELLAV
jgi:inositol-phosphate phosphatase/L-galactose 1-phosphate phosphatase/histidinol-phosphatase